MCILYASEIKIKIYNIKTCVVPGGKRNRTWWAGRRRRNGAFYLNGSKRQSFGEKALKIKIKTAAGEDNKTVKQKKKAKIQKKNREEWRKHGTREIICANKDGRGGLRR